MRIEAFCGKEASGAAIALAVLIIATADVRAQISPVFVDSFNSSRLDLSRWDLFLDGGATASTGTGLQIALNGSNPFSQARAFTFYQFTGDFDAQVDFNLGSGWTAPFPGADTSPQLNGGALVVYLDDLNWMAMFRGRFANSESFNFFSNVDLGTVPRSRSVPSKATTGSLRIVSNSGTYHFLFDTGSGWIEVASAPAWNRPVRLALQAANVNAHVSFSTNLTNFQINSGATDYQPFSLSPAFKRRPDFLAGGQFINEVIRRWIQGVTNYLPMNQLSGQGMNLTRGCMTTVSSPDLAKTPAAQWHTLGWKDSYWSSREMIAQVFKDATAAGMRINACYYLSEGPADAGRQNAPATWKDLSVADTATLLEQYTYDTTTYLLGQGIQVDLYDPGNEILFGILNFRPGDRIAVPPGVNFPLSISYLESSVWPTEATLLTAAIHGIRRADPNARVALHVEKGIDPGLESMVAFFKTMQALGVPYDVAALSIGYADSTDFSAYTAQSYFQRWETVVNRIGALGKSVYIAENSYPASPVAGIFPPIDGFPYSDAGQSAYFKSHLAWASNNPNIIGWAWFYPEWYEGINGGNGEPPVLTVSGLFSDSQTLRPAAAALNDGLPPPACTFAFDANSAVTSAAGGRASVSVSAPFWCRWTPVSNAPWITVTAGTNGMGTGTLNYSVAGNTSTNQRSGTITFAGQIFTVTQSAPATAGCIYALSAGGQVFPVQGGIGTVTITTTPVCLWTVSSLPPSITLTSPASGVGNGTVTFQVLPNGGGDLYGSFTIAGQTFTVEQSAASIAGLAAAGSLGQVVSEGTWDFSLIGINLGASAATARFSFADDHGDPLALPLTFPQSPPAAGPLLAATLDRTLNPNAQIVMDSTGPDSAATLVGSGQLLSNGNVSGFGIFSNPKLHWNAVVPLETRNTNKYLLAFDNTLPLTTGVAVANLAAQAANVPVIIRDDTGVQIGTPTISLSALGHTSFMLNDPNSGFPVTSAKRGTVEFDTPAGGQISVLGLRANGPALTTLPVLASVNTSGGSITHVAYNGGWTSVFYLVNTGNASAQFTLSFFDENGIALPEPLLLPQSGTTTTTAAFTQTLAAGAMLVVDTQADDTLALAVGSAQLTTTGNISGFEIFRWTTFGQEASVPLETRTPNSFELVFDDTNGLTTGVALANQNAAAGNVTARIFDDAGTLLQTLSINLASRGHTSFMLPDKYAATANKRGMVEFVIPQGAKISAIGLRANNDGTLTTIPVLTK